MNSPSRAHSRVCMVSEASSKMEVRSNLRLPCIVSCESGVGIICYGRMKVSTTFECPDMKVPASRQDARFGGMHGAPGSILPVLSPAGPPLASFLQ